MKPGRPLLISLSILAVFPLSFCTGQSPSHTGDQPGASRPVNPYASIEKDPDLDSAARILAGLDLNEGAPEAWKKVAELNSFRQHRQSLGESFARAEKHRLSLMKEWSGRELADVCTEGLDLFYPFSGPDIMTAHAIFPCATNYIMFGLEPPGIPPNIQGLNEGLKARYFGAVRSSLGSILNYSFFRTNDMRGDFRGVLDGLSPILMVFLAREGNELVAARTVTVTTDGTIKERDPRVSPTPEEKTAEAQGVPGIRFYFKDVRDGKIKSVTYFSIDISDSGLAARPYFLKAIGRTAPFTTYIKSASYLMHRDAFAQIRSFVLEKSRQIVEDDSGMPLSFFDTNVWDRSFYGMYTQPIALFAGRFQKDLRNIYLHPKENGVKPLPFGTGYNFAPGDSHLLVARKKAAPATAVNVDGKTEEKK